MDKHTAVPTPLTASAAGSGSTMDTMTTSALYTTTPEKPFSTYSPSTTSTASTGRSATSCGTVFRSMTPVASSTPNIAAHRTMISTGR